MGEPGDTVSEISLGTDKHSRRKKQHVCGSRRSCWGRPWGRARVLHPAPRGTHRKGGAWPARLQPSLTTSCREECEREFKPSPTCLMTCYALFGLYGRSQVSNKLRRQRERESGEGEMWSAALTDKGLDRTRGYHGCVALEAAVRPVAVEPSRPGSGRSLSPLRRANAPAGSRFASQGPVRRPVIEQLVTLLSVPLEEMHTFVESHPPHPSAVRPASWLRAGLGALLTSHSSCASSRSVACSPGGAGLSACTLVSSAGLAR